MKYIILQIIHITGIMADINEDKKTRYIISPKYKKSALEEEFWINTLQNKKTVTVNVYNLYRGGSFYIDITNKEKDALMKKESINLTNYDHELIELWDGGCDFGIDIVNESDFSEDVLDEINTLLYSWPEDNVPEGEDEDDDGYSYEKMEVNGWTESECEYTLTGPYELDKVEIDVVTECC